MQSTPTTSRYEQCVASLFYLSLKFPFARSYSVAPLSLFYAQGGAASGNFLYGKDGKDGFNLWVLHEGNVKLHKISRSQATGQLLYNGNSSNAKTLVEVCPHHVQTLSCVLWCARDTATVFVAVAHTSVHAHTRTLARIITCRWSC